MHQQERRAAAALVIDDSGPVAGNDCLPIGGFRKSVLPGSRQPGSATVRTLFGVDSRSQGQAQERAEAEAADEPSPAWAALVTPPRHLMSVRDHLCGPSARKTGRLQAVFRSASRSTSTFSVSGDPESLSTRLFLTSSNYRYAPLSTYWVGSKHTHVFTDTVRNCKRVFELVLAGLRN